MMAAIVTALLALGAGGPIALALPSHDRRIDLRFIGESYLLGIGAQAGVLFLLAILGVPWSRPIAIVALAAVAIIAALAARRLPPAARLPLHWLDLLTLIPIAGYARFATIAPPTEIDFICIWGLKAEKFWMARGIDWNFLAQPFNAFSHADYPLLVPLAYDFHTLVAGQWIDRWAGALNIGCGIAALLIIRSFLAEELSSPLLAAAGTLILMPLVFSPYVGDAEGPLIAFSIAAILPLRRGQDVTRSAVFLGLAASCKNEGLILIVAVAAALAITGAARLLPRLWPAVAISLPWLVASRLHHLYGDLTESGMLERAVSRLANPLVMLQAMLSHPPGRLIFWIGLLAALIVGARRVVREERFLATVIALQLCAFVAAYLITPHDVSWHVRWSWERLVLQLTGLMTFLAIVVTLPKCSGGRPRPPGARGRAPLHGGGDALFRLLAHVQEEQPDADADGGVGNIECRPVVRLASPVQVDIEEVDHVAEPETIDQIADRAAQDQMQSGLQEAIGDRGAEGVGHHHEENADGADIEQQRDDARLRVGADAEGRAAVAHVHQLKQIRDQRDRIVHVDVVADQPLGPGVERDNSKCDQQVGETFQTSTLRFSSISLSSSTRRRPRISS
jgi:hypothetical protein